MIRRERKLRQSPLSQRAYSLPLASRRDINRQIRLRVVREFNLPDSMAEELESAAYQFEDVEELQQHTQLNSGDFFLFYLFIKSKLGQNLCLIYKIVKIWSKLVVD